MLVSPEQRRNAPLPRLVTLAGIVKLARAVQPWKVCVGMLARLLEKVALVR